MQNSGNCMFVSFLSPPPLGSNDREGIWAIAVGYCTLLIGMEEYD